MLGKQVRGQLAVMLGQFGSVSDVCGCMGAIFNNATKVEGIPPCTKSSLVHYRCVMGGSFACLVASFIVYQVVSILSVWSLASDKMLSLQPPSRACCACGPLRPLRALGAHNALKTVGYSEYRIPLPLKMVGILL